MTIRFVLENVKRPALDYPLLKKVINRIVSDFKFVATDITFIFCDDNYLLDLNVRFLAHNYFTDILTFNYNIDKNLSGDIFISIDRVHDNAKSFNCTFDEEICRVIFHGILHLAGLDDHDEMDIIRMREMEDKYLAIYRELV